MLTINLKGDPMSIYRWKLIPILEGSYVVFGNSSLTGPRFSYLQDEGLEPVDLESH